MCFFVLCEKSWGYTAWLVKGRDDYLSGKEVGGERTFRREGGLGSCGEIMSCESIRVKNNLIVV